MSSSLHSSRRAQPGRTPIANRPHVSRQHLRRAFDCSYKLDVVMYLNKTLDINRVRWRFFPTLSDIEWDSKRKLVYAWRSLQESIEATVCSSMRILTKRRRKIGSGTVLTNDTEAIIINWIDALRSDGMPVSAHMLSLRAQEIAQEQQGLTPDKFKASFSWRRSFLKRHRLSLRAVSRSGKHLNVDGIRRVLNADQTAIFFEYLPSKTLAPTGTSRVFVHCGGKAKQRLTAMVLGDTMGRKYPLFLILKTTAKTPQTNASVDDASHGFGAHYRKTVEALEVGSGCEIYGNKAGCWNEGLSLAFLEFHSLAAKTLTKTRCCYFGMTYGHTSQLGCVL
ncbi:hypothetical protein ACHHYP_20489 [Achlya hypogyna]|uniref:HTH CENPB-type domain-containing protein n=1 Tax=Achlya hypogyna TaxID=1202772 RepID=A0A1V9YL13_ACHHY|nr:hypothetical protein ACHHYP_20489 [Achlya hypogyna]